MLFCRIKHLSVPLGGDLGKGLLRPFVRTVSLLLLTLGSGSLVQAGEAMHEPRAPRPSTSPRPKAFLTVVEEPYLVAVGPAGIRIKPVEGPLVRRAPLLPAPKSQEGGNRIGQTGTSPEPRPAEVPPLSAFSPEAPPVLLPAEKLPVTVEPARKEESKESVLAPSVRRELELRDSVIYFSTPGVSGSRVIVPALVPSNSPAPAALPESRAIYRKEKE